MTIANQCQYFEFNNESKIVPALSMAAFMEIEPSCGAVNEERHPLKEPMGVLAALTMTTSYDEREN